MAKYLEHKAAIAKDIHPMHHFDRKRIDGFLNSQSIPDAQMNILKGTRTGIWKTAAASSGSVGEYITPLSNGKKVPHYDFRKAAMFILKNGPDKVSEMDSKIAEQRARKTAKAAYDPLNMFSDRRTR